MEDPTSLSGSTSLTITVLDVNDNTPKFTPAGPIAVTLADGVAADTLVTTLQLTDADSGNNGAIGSTSLEPITSPFSLLLPPSRPGEVQVRTLKVLDREKVASYNFEVNAFDRGSPLKEGRVRIIITLTDVNDNTPTFEKNKFTGQVLAASPATTAILVVKATDSDEGANAAITYGLETSPGSNFFNLDTSIGLLSVASPFTVDQLLNVGAISSTGSKTYSPLKLTVNATDGGSMPRTGKADVELTIREAASGDPKFTKSVYSATLAENSAAGEKNEHFCRFKRKRKNEKNFQYFRKTIED